VAEIAFSKSEAARLLKLSSPQVDDLVASRVLRPAGTTTDGHPFFIASDVRRAAAEIAFAEHVDRRRRKGKAPAR
jgi:hypothetical protein